MKAIILAGGLGTRLREEVKDVPKPLALVAGRPFIEFILDQLLNSEINEIVLAVGYKYEKIVEHLGYEYHGMKLRYSIEKEPLGTGGAIKKAFEIVGTNPTLVFNGDSYVDLNVQQYINWCREKPERVLMTLCKVSNTSRYGKVKLENGVVVGFSEKGIDESPGLINAGVYWVNPNVFSLSEFCEVFSWEGGILESYCSVLKPRAYVCEGYFIDIGIPSDYKMAIKYFGGLQGK